MAHRPYDRTAFMSMTPDPIAFDTTGDVIKAGLASWTDEPVLKQGRCLNSTSPDLSAKCGLLQSEIELAPGESKRLVAKWRQCVVGAVPLPGFN